MKHAIFISAALTATIMGCASQDASLTKAQLTNQPEQPYELDVAEELVSQDALTMTPAVPAVKTVAEFESLALSVVHEPIISPEMNTENYADVVINAIKNVLTEPVSTFSTDVDTASYTNARRFLDNGQLPPKEAIRVEEFINYFDYQLNKPSSLEQPIHLETETMVTPWNLQTHLLRVSLQAYQSDFEDLPPLNLVFLLDVSGSMSSPDKLPLMQKSFNLLVNQLRPEDRVAIAVYAGDSGTVLEPTAGDQKQTIMKAINNLRSGGSTHGSAGIHLAYELAEQHFQEESINRIILGTDGDFNVGTTNLDDLKSLIEKKRQGGTYLSVLGFGTGNYNDYLMEELSNHGNGTAYYIDSFSEARKIFSEQLTATLQTVAKDVKIQVEFNPDHVAEYRLIGYDNRMLNQEDFNNDKIDAGEMGSGHTVTALYEIVKRSSDFRFNDPLRYQKAAVTETTSEELAFVKVRYKLPSESNSTKMTLPVTETNSETSESMQLAVSIAGFAEVLRDSPYVQDWYFKDAITELKPALQTDDWGYRQELLQLMKSAQALNRP